MGKLVLTGLEEAFCVEFVASGSLAIGYRKSHRNADNWTSQRCHREGRRLYERQHVFERCLELRDAAAENAPVTPVKLAEIFAKRANVTIDEVYTVRVGACRYCNGLAHGYQWRVHEYEEAVRDAERAKKPMPEIGGGLEYDHTADAHPGCPVCKGEGIARFVLKDIESLPWEVRSRIIGIKQTKDGFEVKMSDGSKDLELLGRILGAFKDTVNLQANVHAIKQAALLVTSDPNDAAKAYREMIAGN